MSDPMVYAAASVIVIGALAAGVVTVINAIGALSKTVQATDRKADTIIEKAVEIHSATNGHLSKVTESLNVALGKIEGLENLVASMVDAKATADSLAAQQASTRRDKTPGAR